MSKNLAPADRADAITWLRANLAPGSEVNTVVTHTSASGMTRNVVALAVVDGMIVNISAWLIRAGIGTRPRGQGTGVSISGTAEDLVYRLAYAMYGNERSLRPWRAA